MGLLSAAAACAGAAHVVATDVPEQLRGLQDAVAAICAPHTPTACDVVTAPWLWGDEFPGAVPTAAPFHVAVLADVLFIALRDGLTAQLEAAMVQLLAVSTVLVFAYENRLAVEEAEFMEAFSSRRDVTARDCGWHGVAECDRIVVDGGDVDVPDELFWESPEVRIWVLTAAGDDARRK